jgi:hypothetical protein
MILYDGPTGKYQPCLYGEDGKLIAKGSLEFTKNSEDLTPYASFSTYEAIISYPGYEDKIVGVRLS